MRKIQLFDVKIVKLSIVNGCSISCLINSRVRTYPLGCTGNLSRESDHPCKSPDHFVRITSQAIRAGLGRTNK